MGREAARRALGERPYDVQLLGTLVMLSGHVAEMATGEGKTLSGALAAAAYALRGRSVHVMSVNDYLARRDADWMRPVYDLLGRHGRLRRPGLRRTNGGDAYAEQVTYAPVSEIGLRRTPGPVRYGRGRLLVHRPDVALIDEADSVMIDEALVPLVLAGTAADGRLRRDHGRDRAALLPGLHYEVDDEGRNAS